MSKNISLLIFVPITLWGIGAITFEISNKLKKDEIYLNGKRSIGIVIKKEDKSNSDFDWLENTISYINDEGDSLTFIDASSFRSYIKNDHVKVIYKDNPQVAIVDDPDRKIHFIRGLFIGSMFILLGIGGYFYNSRIKSRSRPPTMA